MKIRARVGWWMRRWADRIDPENTPQAIGWSFTFEHRRGIKFRDDGRGCPLWHISESDYQRAHAESDTAHMIVDWRAARARFGR